MIETNGTSIVMHKANGLPPLETSQIGASEVIGSATVKSVEDLQKYQEWSSAFHTGEYGIATLRFPIPLPDDLPNWMGIPYYKWGEGFTSVEISKTGIAEEVGSRLRAQGVDLLAEPKWFGNELFIYFRTGYDVLLILAVVLGILFLIGILTITISLYKLKKSQLDAQSEAVISRQEGALEVISEIEDEGARAEALKNYLKETEPKEAGLQFDLGFEKPMLILAVFIGIAIVLFALMKGGG